MYVKHDDASDMKHSKNIQPPSKMYVGINSNRAPTKVSIHPIRRRCLQSGLGIEYEDSESKHGDTDEETVD